MNDYTQKEGRSESRPPGPGQRCFDKMSVLVISSGSRVPLVTLPAGRALSWWGEYYCRKSCRDRLGIPGALGAGQGHSG